MNLTFRQMITFREVIRSGSISQAAKTVGRTQPAVSTMISTLENELGFALFAREQGKLSATPEARFFLEECEAVLARMERTERTVQQIRSQQAGKLRIACHPAASSAFLPEILTRFLVDKPALEVSFIMRSSDLIEDLIASQQYDFGFAETPAPRQSINQIDFDLDCVCILRADDPLARNRDITPADLAGQPMAVLFDRHTTTVQTEAAFAAMEQPFHKRFELRTCQPGLQFVAQGLCYMVCDMITAYSYLTSEQNRFGLVMRRFLPRVSNSISILTPGYTSPSLATHAFSRAVEDATRAMQKSVLAELAKHV